jgi:hypothetical protein
VFCITKSHHENAKGRWRCLPPFSPLPHPPLIYPCLSPHTRILKQGDGIGESDVLRPRMQKVSVLSLGYAELLGISTDKLEQCTRGFPHVKRRFRRAASRIDPESIAHCFRYRWRERKRKWEGGRETGRDMRMIIEKPRLHTSASI